MPGRPRAGARARGPPRAARRGGRARRRLRRRRCPPGASRRRRGASRARRARSTPPSPAKQRAQRAAEPLREAERDGVELRRDPGRLDALRDAAFSSRAPSRWTARPSSRRRPRRRRPARRAARRARPSCCACPRARAGPARWSAPFVLGVGGGANLLRRDAAGDGRGGRAPSAQHGRPGRRTRRSTTCEVSSASSTSPGREWSLRAIWFAIVAVGRKSAASCPSSAATRSCSAVTVGSSRFCSSPTAAAAIASRMPGVGRVAVSERRSITAAAYPGADGGCAGARRERRTACVSETQAGCGQLGRRYPGAVDLELLESALEKRGEPAYRLVRSGTGPHEARRATTR